MVLNTAFDGKADVIVSSDKHLTNIGKFKGIRIVNPREFLQIITRDFGEIIMDGGIVQDIGLGDSD